MKKIQIYGPGCSKCNTLAEMVRKTAGESGMNVYIEKVTDPMQFAVAGVLVTPALVVDGKILLSGRLPSSEELKRILTEASDEEKVMTPGTNSCCGGGGSEAAEESSCCCDRGGCSNGNERGEGGGKSGWKRMLLWISIILILLAVIKVANRHSRDASSESGTEPSSLVLKDGVELVYFQYGTRCPSCVRMEAWAKEAVENSFRDEMKEGKLVFRSIQATEDDVRHYEMTSKSLVIREWNGGREANWKNLGRIWDLNGDEGSFKSYVADEVRRHLVK